MAPSSDPTYLKRGKPLEMRKTNWLQVYQAKRKKKKVKEQCSKIKVEKRIITRLWKMFSSCWCGPFELEIYLF